MTEELDTLRAENVRLLRERDEDGQLLEKIAEIVSSIDPDDYPDACEKINLAESMLRTTSKRLCTAPPPEPEADDEEAQEWPLDASRRWWVGDQDGNVFDADADWSGIAVTIEVMDVDEAKAVAGFFLGGEALEGGAKRMME